MLAVTLNPGFVPILAGLLVLGAPQRMRAPTMAGAAAMALWLLLDHEFGAAAAVAQMGLPVVLLNLDALNRIFGIALLIALLIIAMYSSARRSRYEDAAILLLAGGAVSALFVGDLVSFVAAAALAGLAAAWIVFSSPLEGANRAGVRLLIWHGLEGLLFVVGVAFHLSAGAESSIFERLDVRSIDGACIFAALMMRVGAPLAHVWLKDAVSHASPTGGAALSAFTTMLGVYALARLFPAEPLLAPIGGAMIAIGAFYAAAEDDLRRAAAYGLTAHTGVCVALLGLGSPLALAAAEGHAFTSIFAFTALQTALGAVAQRTGAARLSGLEGLARAMPVTTLLMLAAALAAAGVPGLAPYATLAVALEAAAQWDMGWLWAMMLGASAALFVGLALRPALAAYRGSAAPRRFGEAPFAMMLSAGLASFFCLSVGLAPQWLYGLMPAELAFQPFALDHVAPQLELLGAAGVVYLALRAFGLAARPRALDLLDLDALYRGPVAGAGRWAGVLMLRVYGAWQALTERISERGGKAMAAWTRACDRPYSGSGAGAAQLALIAGVLLILLLSSG
jgi:multicomponent Na+:H+ antiporter subunit D